MMIRKKYLDFLFSFSAWFVGRQGGLMVSVLDSGLSVLGLSPGWGHGVNYVLGHSYSSPSTGIGV